MWHGHLALFLEHGGLVCVQQYVTFTQAFLAKIILEISVNVFIVFIYFLILTSEIL